MLSREQLVQLLGDAMQTPPKLITKEILFTEGYILERFVLQLNEEELVPAYFAYPIGAKQCPLVLYNHSHGGDFTKGKEELLSSSNYLQEESFLDVLIAAGYAVGAIDMWAFGERQQNERSLFKRFLLEGKTLWGQRIFDNQQFLTYLLTRDEVDTQRIATIGMSMGGMMSWWLAAVDERVKIVVDLAGQVDYGALIAEKKLDKHGEYYFLPGFLKQATTLEVQQLIAPRPRLSIVGNSDTLCPQSGVNQLNQALCQYYSELGASNCWQSAIVTGGHEETREMRWLWQSYLNKKL